LFQNLMRSLFRCLLKYSFLFSFIFHLSIFHLKIKKYISEKSEYIL